MLNFLEVEYIELVLSNHLLLKCNSERSDTSLAKDIFKTLSIISAKNKPDARVGNHSVM